MEIETLETGFMNAIGKFEEQHGLVEVDATGVNHAVDRTVFITQGDDCIMLSTVGLHRLIAELNHASQIYSENNP